MMQNWHIISCKRFGLPHLRKRLFVIAYSKKIGVDKKQVFKSGIAAKHRTEKMEEDPISKGGPWAIPVRFGSGRIHDTSFWSEMLTKFHHMDNGIPFNIYNGLVAAAGDTVSPRITAWLFSRIKEVFNH